MSFFYDNAAFVDLPSSWTKTWRFLLLKLTEQDAGRKNVTFKMFSSKHSHSIKNDFQETVRKLVQSRNKLHHFKDSLSRYGANSKDISKHMSPSCRFKGWFLLCCIIHNVIKYSAAPRVISHLYAAYLYYSVNPQYIFIKLIFHYIIHNE